MWEVCGGALLLLPVRKPGAARRAHDVPLELVQLVAAGIEMPEAVVRAAQPVRVPVEHQRHVGELAGTLLCQVTAARIRAFQDALAQDRWQAGRRHAGVVRDCRPVRMDG